MKLPKIFLRLLILLISLQFGFGQEKPEAVLESEFGKIPCGQFLSRTDSFFYGLMYDPKSTGYAVIYSDRKDPGNGIWYEKLIISLIYRRKFDKSRLIIIRGEKRETVSIEFWKVPLGAETPKFIEADWSESLPDPTKPFVFGSIDDDNVCPTFIPETYADFIKANPDVLGQLVIFDSSKIQRKARAAEWLKIFTKDFKIPRKRFKVFFVKANKNLPHVEFWIVPKKKK